MNFFKKDNGEDRSFEHCGEYVQDKSGRVHEMGALSLDAEVRAIISEALHSMANQLEVEAAALRREGRSIVEAQAFGAMVSGS